MIIIDIYNKTNTSGRLNSIMRGRHGKETEERRKRVRDGLQSQEETLLSKNINNNKVKSYGKEILFQVMLDHF